MLGRTVNNNLDVYVSSRGEVYEGDNSHDLVKSRDKSLERATKDIEEKSRQDRGPVDQSVGVKGLIRCQGSGVKGA